MLGWLKKHYSQVAEKNWYTCQNNDESMLRPCSKQVKNQLKEQNKSKLQRVIHQLGLVQGKDYNNKVVLKNNVPVRKQISMKQTAKLIKKLNTNKLSTNRLNSSQSYGLSSIKQSNHQSTHTNISQLNNNINNKHDKRLINIKINNNNHDQKDLIDTNIDINKQNYNSDI